MIILQDSSFLKRKSYFLSHLYGFWGKRFCFRVSTDLQNFTVRLAIIVFIQNRKELFYGERVRRKIFSILFLIKSMSAVSDGDFAQRVRCQESAAGRSCAAGFLFDRGVSFGCVGLSEPCGTQHCFCTGAMLGICSGNGKLFGSDFFVCKFIVAADEWYFLQLYWFDGIDGVFGDAFSSGIIMGCFFAGLSSAAAARRELPGLDRVVWSEGAAARTFGQRESFVYATGSAARSGGGLSGVAAAVWE